MHSQVAIIDFGSQYSQLIVRKVRELGYFAKLYHPGEWEEMGKPEAIILSGGPRSVTEEDAPDIDFDRLRSYAVPILGICYGMQLLNVKMGGKVEPTEHREYGFSQIEIVDAGELFQEVTDESTIWMSHSDSVVEVGGGGDVLARNSQGVPVAIAWDERVWGIQFHPEVTHTAEGKKVLGNFLSGLEPRFAIEPFRDELVAALHERVQGRAVVCGVSGGVDSTVLAALLHRAEIALHCIFVDTGLLRQGEAAEVESQFRDLGIAIERVDASERFLEALCGVTDPEEKRRRIGDLFLEVFWEAAGQVDLFAQGTLYPDVIESATARSGGSAAVIKTHHNRVERVLELQREGKVLEPLSELFKDEVRALGRSMGIPEPVLQRHPFPGPGLAVRVPGEVTAQKLDILRQADAIFIEALHHWGWYEKVWQACTTLLPVKSVGVKGDERSYEYPIALRAVMSEDAMTADWVELPHGLLREVSHRILNRVPGVNRVLYDISTKPPASIEWE